MIYSIFLVPNLIIIIGLLLFKYPPKKINIFFGYRTNRSMKNKKNWDYANKCCGKLWIILGLIMILMCFFILIIFKLKSIIITETIASIIILFEVLVIIIPIFIIENKIKGD